MVLSCYLRGVCCWTTRRAVSRRNTSQSGCVMCWSAENGYCCTRHVSHMSSARRRLRELISAMRWASSGGKFRLSLRHTCCSTCTICQPHTATNVHTVNNYMLYNTVINKYTKLFTLHLPSVLWHCWLGDRKGIRPVKNWALAMAWLSVCCEVQTCMWPSGFHSHSLSLAPAKIQIGFTFLVPAHPGSPRQRAIKRLCVCVLFTLHTCTYWISTKRIKSYKVQIPNFTIHYVDLFLTTRRICVCLFKTLLKVRCVRAI